MPIVLQLILFFGVVAGIFFVFAFLSGLAEILEHSKYLSIRFGRECPQPYSITHWVDEEGAHTLERVKVWGWFYTEEWSTEPLPQ